MQRIKCITEGDIVAFGNLVKPAELGKVYPDPVVVDLINDVANRINLQRVQYYCPKRALSISDDVKLLLKLDLENPPRMCNHAIANRMIGTILRMVDKGEIALVTVTALHSNITGLLNEYFEENQSTDFPTTLTGLREKYLPKDEITLGDVISDNDRNQFTVIGVTEDDNLTLKATPREDVFDNPHKAISKKDSLNLYKRVFYEPQRNDIFKLFRGGDDYMRVIQLNKMKNLITCERLHGNQTLPLMDINIDMFYKCYFRVRLFIGDKFSVNKSPKILFVIIKLFDDKVLIKSLDDESIMRITIADLLLNFTEVN